MKQDQWLVWLKLNLYSAHPYEEETLMFHMMFIVSQTIDTKMNTSVIHLSEMIEANE